MNVMKVIKNGIITENPTFVQVIAICPILAVTTSAINGIGMGVATMAVMILSNTIISLIRNVIPPEIRIPSFILTIACCTTIVQFLMDAYAPPALYASLGIFIPLIVVNCAVMARAESFASKNKPFISAIDGLGMGLGFTLSLGMVGAVREILGNGTIFDITILPDFVPRILMMIMAPGAFFTLATLMMLLKHFGRKKGGAKA